VILALRVVKLAFLDLIEEIFLLCLFNILWSISALLVLPLPFAMAGLAWAVAEIGQGKAISWRTFFEGGRRYWKPAYLWALVNLVTWILIYVNFRFYSDFYNNQGAIWALAPLSLLASVGLVWFAVQFYVFPLLIVQEVPSLRLAYRNGLILLASQPVVIIVLLVLFVVLAIVSSLLFILVFVVDFAFIALLANRAVLESVKAAKGREAR
jgi:hypothetical protein